MRRTSVLLATLLALVSACGVVDDEADVDGLELADGKADSSSPLTIPPCKELSRLWTSRYHEALHVAWPVAALDCTTPAAPSFDRAFAQAAYVLEHTRFDFWRLRAGYDPPPDNMLAFVTDKYVGLEIDPNTVFPYTDVETKVLRFYPAVASESGFAVVGNLLHEARHADGPAFLHQACTSGPNAGREMCDPGFAETFVDGGPHSITLLYFAWIATKRSNWTAEAKQGLRALTSSLADERINATDEQRAAWKAKYLRDF